MLELSEIRLPLNSCTTEQRMLKALRRAIARALRCDPSTLNSVQLHRRSIDARHRNDVRIIATARFSLPQEETALAKTQGSIAKHLRRVEDDRAQFPERLRVITGGPRVVVVGAGCAGLFAALTLAHAGLCPLLIERGDGSRDRTEAIERFNKTGELDPNSNIQFGLGGAGTFSDGKLSTGTKNASHRLILETFVKAGAPANILVDAKPHIGSDILPRVVEEILSEIKALGGEVRFRTRLAGIQRTDRMSSIVTLDESGREEHVPCTHLVLATGHSARDVYSLLAQERVVLERKTFAVGVRIEHPQRTIDRALYGSYAGHPALGAAPYKLVAHLPSGRTAYSFCMCPGGTVVAAASEAGGVVTNGASLHARDGSNANAALLVNVLPEDLPGTDVLAGVELQRRCEQRAYEMGGGAYKAPAQLLGDFLERRASTHGGSVQPTYPRGVTWTSLDPLLPKHVIESLRQAFPVFERRIRGYAMPDAVLTGVETRSSAPVTIARDRSCQALGIEGLYPCGEGAGYAGGIMSAATDGIRCAQALIESVSDS